MEKEKLEEGFMHEIADFTIGVFDGELKIGINRLDGSLAIRPMTDNTVKIEVVDKYKRKTD